MVGWRRCWQLDVYGAVPVLAVIVVPEPGITATVDDGFDGFGRSRRENVFLAWTGYAYKGDEPFHFPGFSCFLEVAPFVFRVVPHPCPSSGSHAFRLYGVGRTPPFDWDGELVGVASALVVGWSSWVAGCCPACSRC